MIDYVGDAYSMKYINGSLSIHETPGSTYLLPQIMYVPAERNFITYVKAPKVLNLSPDALKEFLAEFENAKNEMKGLVKLPVNDLNTEYNKSNDILNIRGKDYKVKLTATSSGFQSLVPLFLVSNYLAEPVKQ